MRGRSFTAHRRAAALAAGTALAAAILALASGLARAEDPEDAGRRAAKALLEKASKALGEDRAWTTRIEKGLFIEWDTEGWGTLRADYTRWIKKPDKLKIDQDNSAYDHPFFRMYCCTGGEAWGMVNLQVRQSPQLTASLKTVIERADGIRSFLAASDSLFIVETVPDDSIFSGGDLARAGCVLGGDTILFDIQEKTNLLVRRIEDKASRAYLFEDYRDVGGRLMPFHVVVYDGERKASEYLWHSIVFDEEIDDAIFEENRPPKR